MSKRPEYDYAKDPNAKHYWRGLAEQRRDTTVLEQLPAEFPREAIEPPDGVSRRDFFNLMGASVALAGLAACRRPEEKIVPYSHAPEEQLPGTPMYYATATTFGGSAVGLIVEAHDGRPTKLEGNPQHPDNPGGGLSPWVQASVLDLYDPDRSDRPRLRKAGKGHEDSSWLDASKALKAMGQRARSRQGQGLAIVTTLHRSPTLRAVLAQLKQAMPQARIVRYEAANRDAQRDGARLAFGRPAETVLDLPKAKVIVSLDADILAKDGSIVRQANGFSQGRKPGADMNRLYVVESAFTVTGGAADHRLRLQSRHVPGFALALAAAMGAELGGFAQAAQQKAIPADAQRWAQAVAKDLMANRGAGVVVAGPKQPPVVHAICCAINAALGNVGGPVRYTPAFDEQGDGATAMVSLAQGLSSGQIDTLIILGGNPVFDAPADAGFTAELLDPAKIASVHLSSHFDETSRACVWHLNRTHDLERWGDVMSEDGTASIIQPIIAPLFDARSDQEVVSLLLGEERRGYELTRGTWLNLSDMAWRKALHDGVIEGPRADSLSGVQLANVVRAAASAGGTVSGMEVTFAPDPHAWDGRFANNPWLQEWPDPMQKLTWANAALVSPATAAKLGISDGQTIALDDSDGHAARLPVIITPGQADDSIAVTFGMGRKNAGRVGDGFGNDTFGLRTSQTMGVVGDVKATVLGGDANLARTQEHFALEPMAGWERRPLVREGSNAEFQRTPNFARKYEPKHPELLSLWTDQKVDIVHKWGLAIDLNLCTGCGACMVACQSENNIPVVGPDGVRRTREMNWLRVDRYYEGSAENPVSVAQPMPCQQCENAPCEQVCPVAATTHSPEGLNDMAYNRCVGTRYCANNCPFKVRKFNFFNYHKHLAQLTELQYNPDVTVRSRGVMEKCTFCVQRIQEAKIDSKRRGTDAVADGAIKTACQQSCPHGAITFGDYNDKDSQLSKLDKDPRAYRLLEELNIRPRTMYLAKVRNTNPDLEQA